MALTKTRKIGRILNLNSRVTALDSDFVRVVDNTVNRGGVLSVVATINDLPGSPDTGDRALVSDISTLYVRTENGWSRIALINSFNPEWITQPDSTYDLATNSTPTVITMLATDSDLVPIKYIATTDSSFDAIATVSHDSDKHNVFTVVPIDSEGGAATGGTGTITFKATDGVNLVQQVSTFSLSFGPEWTGTVPDATSLTSPQGSGGRFGYCGSFNSDGTYAAVGSIGTNDTVTIFTRSGSTWSQQQHITGMDSGGPYSIELTSDATRFVVGFPFTTVTNQYDGSAAVYVRSGTSWSKESDIDAAATMPQQTWYGHALSIAKTSGDYIIIGARDDDPASGNASQGAAYIYKRTGSSWAQQQEITSSDGAANDQFGYSVAMNGDGTVVAVGARGADGTITNSGAVYIFTRSGSTWSQSQKIPMPSPSGSAYFGESCMITPDGNYLAIGAWQAAGAGNPHGYPGSVYVYTNNGSNSFSLQTGSPFSHGGTNSAADFTGLASINSLSISDSGKFVSAGTGYGGEQKVWLWEYSGSSWTERYVFTPSNMNVSGVTSTHKFGQYTAMSGNGSYIGIGAFRYNSDVGAWWVNPAPSE